MMDACIVGLDTLSSAAMPSGNDEPTHQTNHVYRKIFALLAAYLLEG
jgi:hypothetical protein